MKRLKKYAFTLVELLLVVGIIASASTAAYVAYAKYVIYNKTNLVAADVLSVSNAIDQILQSGYGLGPAPYGSMMGDLYRAKLLPSNLEIANDLLAYSKASDAYFYAGGYNTAYNFGGIELSQVDTSLCRALTARLYYNFSTVLPYSALGGLVPGTGYNWTPTQAPRPTMERAQQACDDYSDNGKISIIFTKQRHNGWGGYWAPY